MKLHVNSFNLALAEACLSRQELANKSGVSESTITKGLGGKVNLKPKTIGKLAKALDVAVKELVEKDMTNTSQSM